MISRIITKNNGSVTMSEKLLPQIELSKTEAITDSNAIFDRDSSLLIVNLDKPNDYSGEFINSGLVCLSLDSNMEVEDLEAKFSVQDATIKEGIKMPEGISAKIAFKKSFLSLKVVTDLFTNPEMDLVHIRYSDHYDEDSIMHMKIADNLILDISMDNYLVGIWINDIKLR